MADDLPSGRPALDQIVVDIADYVANGVIDSDLAYDTARNVLIDSIGCAVLALRYPECTKLLGPIVPGTQVPNGARVPGTQYELDPVCAAFNTGCMIRWLDYNDTFLAAEGGHPSDNLGGILSTADYISRSRLATGAEALTTRHILTAMIKAHEIQGVLSLGNSLINVGLDHVLFVKVPTTAVVTGMLGGGVGEIANAVSNAWIEASPLRVYRQAPNAGSRKSWAAGEATSEGVWLALMAMKGEMGYPSALTAKRWGFSDVLLKSNPVVQQRPYGAYVMENILFKIAFPAEFHAQTAVECALKVHKHVKDRLELIESVKIITHERSIRIIDKTGPLHNPADRDHCLQYMVAIGLIFGTLTADHYEDDAASDPRIDALRDKMVVVENPQYTEDYHDPDKRSIANAIEIRFKDGSTTEKVEVEFPLGHRRRRAEGIPLLEEKFAANLATRFPPSQAKAILQLCLDQKRLESTPVNELMDMLVV